MTTPTSIVECFAPLNARIYEYQNFDSFEGKADVFDAYAEGLMKIVYLNVIKFSDAQEIYHQATLCEKDILRVLQDLPDNIEALQWSHKDSYEAQQNLMYELYHYLNILHLLKERYPLRGEATISNVNRNTDKETNKVQKVEDGEVIPISFQPKDYEKDFQAKLSEKEAALLTHYLEVMTWMPKYEKASKARLAKFLFGRGYDNIRGIFSDTGFPASPSYHKDLISLKQRLSSLLDQLDADIKEAESKKSKRK